MATPMTASQFLAALRAENVDAREYGDWRNHERDDETGKAFGPVNGVVIHHTVSNNSLAFCYNGSASLPGPLCHTHLAKSGVASMLSAGRANHAGTFAQNAHDAVVNESSVHPYPDSAEPVDGNDHYYGIEIENWGNGTDVYPWVQYVAAVRWATAICRFHGWSHNSVIGHKEGTRRKVDPSGPVEQPGGNEEPFTMNQFRADVKAALALPAGVWPQTAPVPPVEEDEVPAFMHKRNPIDVTIEAARFTPLAFDAAGYLLQGPASPVLTVQVFLDKATTPDDLLVEGRFFLTDLDEFVESRSAYMIQTRHGGGGHTFHHSVPVPAGRKLWFELAPFQQATLVTHREVSGPYWV